MRTTCHSSLSTLGILILAGLLTGCSHLYYYPTQYMYVNVEKLEPRPKQIEIPGPEQKKIIGWYFKSSDKPRARLLFFHGNAENISSHFVALHWILKHGYDFFIFDYPGYGGSEGEPTKKSTTDVGRVALEWLSKQEPHIPIALFGQSLGGNIALYTAATNHQRIPLCMVTVESTFKSYQKVAQRVLENQWWSWPFQWLPYVVTSEEYSARDVIQDISPTPLLVIHSEADTTVKFENGEEVYQAAREPKEFWRLPHGAHIQAFTGPDSEKYQKLFLTELEKNCSPETFK